MWNNVYEAILEFFEKFLLELLNLTLMIMGSQCKFT